VAGSARADKSSCVFSSAYRGTERSRNLAYEAENVGCRRSNVLADVETTQDGVVIRKRVSERHTWDVNRHFGEAGNVTGGPPRLKQPSRTGLDDTLIGVNGTLTGVNGTLTGINGTLTGINGTLTGINGTLTGINGTLTGVNGTLTGLDDALTSIPAAQNEIVRTRRTVANVAMHASRPLHHWGHADIFAIVEVVDLPGTSGRIRISAPAACNAATSLLSSDSTV
jgi:hypothetical protein